MFQRVILIVLDSAGIGSLPDYEKFDDEYSNTIYNTAKANGGLHVPHMESFGLSNIIRDTPIKGVEVVEHPKGFYGKMTEKSNGKDTTVGHWEIAGIVTDKPFPTYAEGFPDEVIKPFEEAIGKKVLGNKPASGTAIIEELGEEHMKTGRPIVYTSADSVFQIAAHEEVIPLEKLYEICQIAREILVTPHNVGRVIARPFIGEKGNFTRTKNRRDFSVKPPKPTVLDKIKEKGLSVVAIGKISDIFAGQGVTKEIHTRDNTDGMAVTLKQMEEEKEGLIFTNLVDFDMLYGHRNDYKRYGEALEKFDQELTQVLDKMTEEDLLMITADHGCDPTTISGDHSREYVPLLVYHKGIKEGKSLGIRASYSDAAATIADIFGIEEDFGAVSFYQELLEGIEK